jgi:RNA polymerase sigma-70 factor (ECF subfamily)
LLRSAPTATLEGVQHAHSPAVAGVPFDRESRAWVDALAGPRSRDAAAADLHALLLRVARFELVRRRAALPSLGRDDLDDLAVQAADDALAAILRKLDTYAGRSRFTTWAAKFAILEASVKARRRAWQAREVTLDPDGWRRLAAGRGGLDQVEGAERLRRIGAAIGAALTPHQREILVAVTLDGVPIDVLAERLHTTRGAIYKTLHDARRSLRAHLAEEEDG